MYTLAEPDAVRIDALLNRLAAVDFSYPDVALSFAHAGPSGYVVNQSRVCLGKGPTLFEHARRGIETWAMYPRNLVGLHPADPTVAAGTTVASSIRFCGIWVTSLCRIVDVRALYDPATDIDFFGFAYGTVADHPLQGEELFSVEYHRGDESVWYHLFSFSRPVDWLARLAIPGIRGIQRRFRTASVDAMVAWCHS